MSSGAAPDDEERAMNSHVHSMPRWATAADGEAVDTSPLELSALGEHLQICRGSRGRLMALSHAAQTMHGFAAARLITTLVLVSALIAAVSWLL
jgi:hypothetical protein